MSQESVLLCRNGPGPSTFAVPRSLFSNGIALKLPVLSEKAHVLLLTKSQYIGFELFAGCFQQLTICLPRVPGVLHGGSQRVVSVQFCLCGLCRKFPNASIVTRIVRLAKLFKTAPGLIDTNASAQAKAFDRTAVDKCLKSHAV